MEFCEATYQELINKIEVLENKLKLFYNIEAELSASQNRFKALAENIPGAVYQCYNDAEYTMLYMNDGIERVAGRTKEEFLNHEISYTSLIHPDDLKTVQNAIEESIQFYQSYHIIYRLKHKTGVYKWVEEYGTGIFENNELQFLEGLILDINDKKLAELELETKNKKIIAQNAEIASYNQVLEAQNEAIKLSNAVLEETNKKIHKINITLKESENRFRQITELSPFPIAIIGKNKFEYINPKFVNTFGYSYDEVKNGVEFVNQAFPDIRQRQRALSILEQKSLQHLIKILDSKEGLIVCKNQELRQIIYHIKPITADQLVVIFEDITEYKQNQELQKNVELAKQSADFKQQFLATMSHEIRTPIAGIIGMTDLLLKTKQEPQQQEYAENIKNQADSLLNIINDILVLSKIEAGKLKIIPNTFSLQQTIKSITDIFAISARQKNLQIIPIINPAIPSYIKTDENRIKQIINNFVSNALKFTDKGSITIKATPIESSTSKIKIKIEVIDTGIGIKEHEQEKLFRDFAQVEESYTRNSEGIGLGLHICKKIISMMQGEVGLISQEGAGSNFWFTFEAEKINNAHLKQQNNSETLTDIKIDQHILLVEDKFVNQKIVSLMLTNAGCIVDIANNGLEALAKFDINKHQIILMDIQMPEMDGLTATKELKKKYSNLPPVIGLSANAMEGDAERFISEGLDDYLSKPFTSEILYRKIIKWIKN